MRTKNFNQLSESSKKQLIQRVIDDALSSEDYELMKEMKDFLSEKEIDITEFSEKFFDVNSNYFRNKNRNDVLILLEKKISILNSIKNS